MANISTLKLVSTSPASAATFQGDFADHAVPRAKVLGYSVIALRAKENVSVQ